MSQVIAIIVGALFLIPPSAVARVARLERTWRMRISLAAMTLVPAAFLFGYYTAAFVPALDEHLAPWICQEGFEQLSRVTTSGPYPITYFHCIGERGAYVLARTLSVQAAGGPALAYVLVSCAFLLLYAAALRFTRNRFSWAGLLIAMLTLTLSLTALGGSKALSATAASIRALFNAFGPGALHQRLLVAVVAGDIETARYFLERGANPDRAGVLTNDLVPPEQPGSLISSLLKPRPLFAAIALERMDIVKLLMEYGADINIEDYGKTPLVFAVARRDPAFARLLLERGARITDGAVRSASGDTLELLLKAGAPVDLASPGQMTRFTSACFKYSTEYLADSKTHLAEMKLLLEAGADPMQKDTDGRNCLFWIADAKTTYRGETPELLELTRLLIDRGLDVAMKDRTGATPIDLALGKGYRNMARLMIEHVEPGSVPDAWLKLWRAGMPRHVQVLFNNISAKRTTGVRLLLEAGVDPNERAHYKEVLLIEAARRDRDLTALLLDHGAKIDAADQYGNTALNVAASRRDVSTMQLLLDRGARSGHFRNNEGRSALDLAETALKKGDHRFAPLVARMREIKEQRP